MGKRELGGHGLRWEGGLVTRFGQHAVYSHAVLQGMEAVVYA